MRRRSAAFLVLLAASFGACAHAPATIARAEWCDRVEAFKENDRWQCTWPPSRYAPGDFGPRENLGRYNLAGAVLDRRDLQGDAGVEVRRIGTLDLAYGRTVTVDAKAGFSLRSLSPWLPDATLSASRTTTVSLRVRLEDAEWRMYRNVAPIIATGLRAETTDLARIESLARGRDAICRPGTSLVEGVLVGKLSASIDDAARGGGGARIGWARVGGDVTTSTSERTGLTVASGGEKVAVLYLVNPAADVLRSFDVCSMSARAPAPSCGDGKCGLGERFDRGMAQFVLAHYDEAIREFEAGFLDHPSSEFVFNIAVAHQLAGRKPEAITGYQRYLQLRPDAPNRAQVEAALRALGVVVKREVKSDLPDDLAAPDLAQPGPAAPAPAADDGLQSPAGR